MLHSTDPNSKRTAFSARHFLNPNWRGIEDPPGHVLLGAAPLPLRQRAPSNPPQLPGACCEDRVGQDARDLGSLSVKVHIVSLVPANQIAKSPATFETAVAAAVGAGRRWSWRSAQWSKRPARSVAGHCSQPNRGTRGRGCVIRADVRTCGSTGNSGRVSCCRRHPNDGIGDVRAITFAGWAVQSLGVRVHAVDNSSLPVLIERIVA